MATTQPVQVSRLPLFTNMRARCVACGQRGGIMVIFCRDCELATGADHFHRRCGTCLHAWVEQTTERPH